MIDNQIESLKEQIAILEGIQSAMPDPYYVRDMDYNIVLWPETIAKLTGYSEAEAKRLKCYEIFKACVCPPNNACPTQHCITVKKFLRDVAVDVYHKSGKTIHSLVSNAGVYNEKGEPIAAVEVVKDNTKLQNSLGSIGGIIKEIDSASDSLSTISEHVSAISNKVNNTAQDTMAGAKTGVHANTSVSQKIEHSTRQADDVQVKMQRINDSMKAFIDKISNLEMKSENIVKSVSIIQDIARETDLLSINAAIQAVRAGEAGKGFKVVAEGVKELSQNSSKSAEAISITANEIITLMKEIITALNTTEKDVKTGTQNISELLAFMGDIDNSMKGLSDAINTIESGATLTYKLGEEQNLAVVEINDASRKLSEIARKLTQEFDRVTKAIQHTDMG
ncbi:MAG: methyl-accepting chemotaxis protein [Fibromonadales bacterium]|nr:methyl-accepting chemotaxis protein [Fibromonadales bacterium]